MAKITLGTSSYKNNNVLAEVRGKGFYRAKYAGYLMLISGIFGFIAVSAFWIISGLMLIIGGALALREK